MKNERNITVQENGQEPRHKYRLNKRKFTIALALFCFVIAAVIIAAHYAGGAEGKEAIAALNPPQATPGSSPAVSNIDPKNPLKGKTIIVDAGHGGDDPGAAGANGSVESELNLSVALLLKQQLEDKGASVVMTRNDENALAETKDGDWEERGKIIHESSADALVSVHMNTFNDSSVSGPVVLFIAGSIQGKKLADAVQKRMNEKLEPEAPGITRSEDLIILKYGYQPSVLAECGYISNPQEEDKLNTEEYQLQVAKAICSGVIEYFLNK